MRLERGLKGLLQDAISELGDMKLQSYSNFKIELLKFRKGDMRKFDGKDPVNWILQMEKYFDLHEVQLLQKVRIASSYLEPNQFLRYKGLFYCKPLVTWSIFMEEMIAHYEDTKRNTFFSQLINLKQKCSMVEHIEDLQKLNIRGNDIPEKQRIDVSIGTLKDNIQHEVRLWEPDSLEKAFRLARKVESKIMATRKSTPHNYKYGSFVSPSLPKPTRLTPQQLEEKSAKGICYNCDNKYIKGHNCAENKLFYIDCEEEEEKDQETSKEEDIHQEPTPEKEEMNLTIYCKALARITTPQTLKIEGHIKKKNVQEVKDHIKHQEMNPTISCNALAEITIPQTLKIEGHIKHKKVQAVKDHIEHQQQVLQILKDNATLVQN